MIGRRQRRAAVETLWMLMVERAEAANDVVVAGQRASTAAAAVEIAECARDVVTLARAVALLTQAGENAA